MSKRSSAVEPTPEPAEPAVIGWRERVSLPGIGIRSLRTKIDTGARTSALHAVGIRRYDQDGVPRVRFRVVPGDGDRWAPVALDLEMVDLRSVRNPGGGGRDELRPVIVTPVVLAGQRWDVEVTLTRRDTMEYRMLLGREALRGRFVVDSARSYSIRRRTRRTGR